MTSAVPPIQFTPAGLVLPSDAAILAGVQSDINNAFGGGLNPGLSTPQGQIASSTSAIISDKNTDFAYFTNQVDPQFATGRFQDAIARIYFLNRKGAEPTTVTCTLTGVPGTIVNAGVLAQDTSGNTYVNVDTVIIGSGGTVTAQFQNILTGPIPCPNDTLIQVYQTVPGWDAITNPQDGELGSIVESPADFELRRQNSVAKNAHGSLPSIYANVFDLPNVLDVYALQNDQQQTYLVGSISGTTLNVTSVISGKLIIGQVLLGSGIAPNTFITAFGSGSGQGGTYSVNNSQTVGSEIIQIVGCVFGSTNYMLVKNSLYVAVVGGAEQDIGDAIWDFKDLGCSYNGNTTVQVVDTSGYNYPQPTYNVQFEIPDPLPIYFAVQIVNNPSLPSNIVQLVKQAIINRFNGADGTTRERIGSIVFASRYYGAIANASPIAVAISILIGTSPSPSQTTVGVGIDEYPSLTSDNISVSLV